MVQELFQGIQDELFNKPYGLAYFRAYELYLAWVEGFQGQSRRVVWEALRAVLGRRP